MASTTICGDDPQPFSRSQCDPEPGNNHLVLGIDAGGTYTDAVLIEHNGPAWTLVSKAKALTTPTDLSEGIGRALDQLDIPAGATISRVSLATTLATNAIVEKRGGRVGLLLLGYDPKALAQFNLLGNLPVTWRRSLAGRMDEAGREAEPLDEGEVRAALSEMSAAGVEALAVSGAFSVVNPAHEQSVREMAADLTPLPPFPEKEGGKDGLSPLPSQGRGEGGLGRRLAIVCGHELTGRLDAVKRAVTASLNARLLPIIDGLVAALEQTLDARGIQAPIAIMGGNGRLLPLEEARRRPVETILSGPAASVAAARAVHPEGGAIVIDMGGTTSDIAVLRDGQPGLSPDGALVGGWATAVSAVDVRTCGLGGDSHIRLVSGRLHIGPRRATPVCQAAAIYPGIMPHLRRLSILSDRRVDGVSGSLADFVVQVRDSAGLTLNWQERAVLEVIQDGPAPVFDILERMDSTRVHVHGIDQLEDRGVVARIGLTPTDLQHAAGEWVLCAGEAAEAAVIAARIVSRQLELDVAALRDRVVEQMVDALAVEVMARVLKDEGLDGANGVDAYLLRRALDFSPDAPLDCSIALRDPLVGLGAPAAAFLPRLAEKLHTECICPQHSEVGVALGAALGSS